MAGLIVVDASALIAYLDAEDTHHDDAMPSLIAVDRFVVHPVTLAEVPPWARIAKTQPTNDADVPR